MLVAQSLSFKAAADQLYLSPSAVSRQIQGLEESLGELLFERGNRQISLTATGKTLLSGTEQAFAILDKTLHQLKPDKKHTVLRVGAQQYFSNNWLFPRISEFLAQHDDVEIQFESSSTYRPFDEEVMDICIRFTPEDNTSLHCEAFFPQQAVLVAAPSLVAQHDLLAGVDRALSCEWLAVRTQPTLMQQWFKAHLLEGHNLGEGKLDQHQLDQHNQIFFDDAQAALMAAKEGVGVVLAAWPLIDDLITTNQLVQLGPPSTQFASDYYLVYPKSLANYPPLLQFKHWLVTQVSFCLLD